MSHYTFQPPDHSQVVNTNNFGNEPLEVSRYSGLTGLDLPFANALESTLGLQQEDFTDGTGIGYDLGLASIRVPNRTRSYALNTFGYEMPNRPNVKLIHNAWVKQIGLLRGTAQNTTYADTSSGETHTITAKEIFISGGAINSPQTLMLSGVGPKPQLSALKIPVVADIPGIGANLNDHHYSSIELAVTSNSGTFWPWDVNATGAALAKVDYAANESGPLGWNNGDIYAGFRLADSVLAGVGSTD